VNGLAFVHARLGGGCGGEMDAGYSQHLGPPTAGLRWIAVVLLFAMRIVVCVGVRLSGGHSLP